MVRSVTRMQDPKHAPFRVRSARLGRLSQLGGPNTAYSVVRLSDASETSRG